MLMSLGKFMEHLLCAMTDASDNNDSTAHNLFDVAIGAGLTFRSGWIDYAALRLEKDGFIETLERLENVDIDKRFLSRKTTKGKTQSLQYKLKIKENIMGLTYQFIDNMADVDWFALGSLLVENNDDLTDGYLTALQLSERDPDGYDENHYQESLQKLYDWNLVRRDPKNQFRYHLTTRGVFFTVNHAMTIFDFVQSPHAKEMTDEIIDTLDEILEWHESAHAIDPLEGSSHDEPNELEAIPASDRTVTLDHNKPAYRDVVEKLEELKAAIEANNNYRDTDLADHERRLTDIEITLKILQNKRVNVNALKAVALGTLAYLAEKFSEHPIGELAKAAWDGLKALLGL